MDQPDLPSLPRAALREILAHAGTLSALALRATCSSLRAMVDSLAPPSTVVVSLQDREPRLLQLPARYPEARVLRLDGQEGLARRLAEAFVAEDVQWPSITQLRGCPLDAGTLALLLAALPSLECIEFVSSASCMAAASGQGARSGTWGGWVQDVVWPGVGADLAGAGAGSGGVGGSGAAPQTAALQACLERLAASAPGVRRLAADMPGWRLGEAASAGLLRVAPQLVSFTSPASRVQVRLPHDGAGAGGGASGVQSALLDDGARGSAFAQLKDLHLSLRDRDGEYLAASNVLLRLPSLGHLSALTALHIEAATPGGVSGPLPLAQLRGLTALRALVVPEGEAAQEELRMLAAPGGLGQGLTRLAVGSLLLEQAGPVLPALVRLEARSIIAPESLADLAPKLRHLAVGTMPGGLDAELAMTYLSVMESRPVRPLACLSVPAVTWAGTGGGDLLTLLMNFTRQCLEVGELHVCGEGEARAAAVPPAGAWGTPAQGILMQGSRMRLRGLPGAWVLQALRCALPPHDERFTRRERLPSVLQTLTLEHCSWDAACCEALQPHAGLRRLRLEGCTWRGPGGEAEAVVQLDRGLPAGVTRLDWWPAEGEALSPGALAGLLWLQGRRPGLAVSLQHAPDAGDDGDEGCSISEGGTEGGEE